MPTVLARSCIGIRLIFQLKKKNNSREYMEIQHFKMQNKKFIDKTMWHSFQSFEK